MRKILLFAMFISSFTFTTLSAEIYYYGTSDREYNYDYYKNTDTVINNTTQPFYSGKRSDYSVRLILSGYDDIVLELTSVDNINNDVYLVFEGGIIKPMKRYSNKVYYFVFDNYIDLDAIVVVNSKNIFVEQNLKAQLKNDYNYIVGVVNNRYYRDRYYKDFNFQYRR